MTVALLNGCTDEEPAVKTSPHYWDGEFHNTHLRPESQARGNIISLLLFGKWGRWPDWVENTAQPELRRADEGAAVITFINHATFLIELDQLTVLTDPMFSKTAGPWTNIGANRHRPPGVALADLPKIDWVLISHNHYDHLDLPTLAALRDRDNPLIFVPLGNKKWLETQGFSRVIALDWWQMRAFDPQHRLTFVPAQHFSGRGLWDRNESFWGGYVLETPELTLFFAGDTGYGDHFKTIGARFDLDVALLPIGAYLPQWFQYVHLTPAQAVQAHLDLKRPLSIPMHYETFRLSQVDYGVAAATLRSALNAQRVEAHEFTVLPVGGSLRWPQQ